MSANREDTGVRVLREMREGVGIIALNRPEVHNAIDDALRAQWREALLWAAQEKDVRAIVVHGRGPSFCSGRDTRALGERPEGITHEDYVEAAQAIRLLQVEIRKPMIAAIHGHVVGAGAELALGTDFRIAADNLQFRLPEVHYGLVADTGATVLLTSLAGPSRAKWMLMSGEAIDARCALDWGLVERVVAPERLLDEALAMARTLASRPPEALASAKNLIDSIWATELRSGLKRELAAQLALFHGEEYQTLRTVRQTKRQR